MNERTNYSGHYSGQASAPRPQGIVFRMSGKGNARFSPYMWLAYADMDGNHIKLDFGSYGIVVRAHTRSSWDATYSLDSIFEAIARHELAEISEKEGMLSIEIIEKEEQAPAGAAE